MDRRVAGPRSEEGRCLYLPRFDARELPAPRPGRGFGMQLYQGPAGESAPISQPLLRRDAAASGEQSDARPRRRDAWGIPVLHIDCSFGERELVRAREQSAALRALAEVAGVTLTRIDR